MPAGATVNSSWNQYLDRPRKCSYRPGSDPADLGRSLPDIPATAWNIFGKNTGDRLHLGDDSGSGGRLQSFRNLAMASRRGRDFGIGDSGGGADLYLPLLLSKKEDKWQC